MSERKIQTRSFPLRVRIRPGSDSLLYGRDTPETPLPAAVAEPAVTDETLSQTSKEEKRSRQIKELLRLCDLLRADISLNDVLDQIATSLCACTGFRALAINLLDEQANMLRGVAFTGLSREDEQLLRNTPFPVDTMNSLLRPEFRMSQSYFIPHQYNNLLSELPLVSPSDYEVPQFAVPGSWHPEDVFIVPLYSPREHKAVGFLSLDNPEDGKLPTLETTEIVELFANKAAMAIDNARIFQERETERIALESGIAALHEDLERLKNGDLQTRIRSTHPKLASTAEAINAMVKQLNAVFVEMREVTLVADEHARYVHRYSDLLVSDTTRQERLINQVSQVIGDFAAMIKQISERAAHLSQTAVDTTDVTIEAQGTVDRAMEGMGQVREAILHSARTMKNLSESGQEINEAVSVMGDLTMRMHLLSLNAAIEATRAGEHGKGFVVIAQEIRSLAAHSSEATRKVGTYIRTIQQETAAVSHSVEQSTQQVVMQTELVTRTGVSLDAISAVTEQLSNLIQGVVKSVENHDQSSLEIVQSVSEIHRITGDSARHMQEVQQSMLRLAEMTTSLRSRLSQARLQ